MTIDQIAARLDNPMAEHRCPECDATMTVDRSRGDIAHIECGDIFCDVVIVARRTADGWAARLCDPGKIAAPPAGGEWMPRRGHAMEVQQ
jgi:hypothetical protein